MLWSDWLRHCTLSAISVQWLEVVYEMATFFSVFPKVLRENLCKWIIEFQRRLNEGHLRILDLSNMYGSLTKCKVKMAGYWPSSFFCVFMDGDEVEVHKFAKKRTRPIKYPAILTKQTWSLEDLLHGFWWNFPCGIQRVVPSGKDGSILPARVANHSARFGSSCPLAELAIQ